MNVWCLITQIPLLSPLHNPDNDSNDIKNDINQGSRGRRILRPGTHISWSGLLKIPKAESAGRMFFFPWDYYLL